MLPEKACLYRLILVDKCRRCRNVEKGYRYVRERECTCRYIRWSAVPDFDMTGPNRVSPERASYTIVQEQEQRLIDDFPYEIEYDGSTTYSLSIESVDYDALAAILSDLQELGQGGVTERKVAQPYVKRLRQKIAGMQGEIEKQEESKKPNPHMRRRQQR